MKESIYLLLNSQAESLLFRAWALMLLHSVWQGMLLHILASLLLRYKKWGSAAMRYNLLLLHFMVFLAACGVTLALQLSKAPTNFILALPGQAFSRVPSNSWWSFIIWPWLIAFLFHSIRLGFGLTNDHRIARLAANETNPYWQHRVDKLAKLLGISNKIRLIESSHINAPAIIGVLKPIILVPMGVLASLPANQLEAVLLHELAHIRRNDYLVNLVQAIAEAIFFFNPALRWLSAKLREERENCCDDMALAHVNKVTFVKALVSFQEYAIYRQAFPLAFTGQKGQLLARVSRITGHPTSSSRRIRLKLLIYLVPGLLLGWLYLNYTTTSLKQKPAITKHGDLRYIHEINRVNTGVMVQSPQVQKIHKTTRTSRSKSTITYMGVVSPANHGADSISSISPALGTIIISNVQAQSEYEQNIANYNLKMVQYHETLKAYNEEMVQHQKKLQAYNEEMVQHKKTLQLYNEQMGNQFNNLPGKPSG